MDIDFSVIVVCYLEHPVTYERDGNGWIASTYCCTREQAYGDDQVLAYLALKSHLLMHYGFSHKDIREKD